MRNEPTTDVAGTWARVVERLSQGMSQAELRTWILPLRPLALDQRTVRIEVPSKAFYECLSETHLGRVRQAIAETVGERPVRFEINEQVQGELFPTLRPRKAERHPLPVGSLVPEYTFASFVVGPGNQFAHAASRAVANQPGERYNPLFIYGGVGLGKTHLLNAVGHHILARHPGLRIAYLPSRSFMNELVASLRQSRMDGFRERFRRVDVLLLDDVQSLAGKEGTQEEFFHTFNWLYEHHRQIVLTSDKFPKDIPDLEERLRNRFEWGLIADIQPPDVETRIAILQKKAAIHGLSLRHEVALFLATHIDSNVRELEGSLNRLAAYARITRTDMTVELARTVLEHLLKPRRSTLTADDIRKAVCDHFGIGTAELSSRRRARAVVLPRQVAMYLCRKLLGASFPTIGRMFGNRDHSTAIHAIAVTEQRLREDHTLGAAVERIERSLQHS